MKNSTNHHKRIHGVATKGAAVCAALALALGVSFSALAQPPEDFQPPGGGQGFDGAPPFGGGGFMPGGPGRGGPGGGGPMQQKVELVKQFDKDGDGHLNTAERKAARAWLATNGQGRGRRGGPRGGGGEGATPTPGVKVSPADVKSAGNAALYDAMTLRTIFIDFEDADWEKEMAEFKNTDVDVPAKLTVDGKVYADVGMHFHGMSSFMMVGEGQKRSMNIDLNLVHDEQRLNGYRSLTLLNAHEDPSFLRSVLYYQVAREYVPAPKANFVRVVINGENWGIYANAQHFDKDFIKDAFGSAKGARWKVPGSPNGRGSLNYIGDDVSAYKRIYEIKSKDDAKSWNDLVKLCKTLDQTPADQLEKALEPLLDVDGALKFMALESSLINNDGYWIRTSDYSIYEDEKGKFHIVPHDANETFLTPGGPGFGGGGGRGRGPGGMGGGPGGNGRGGNGGGGFAGGPNGGGQPGQPAANGGQPNGFGQSRGGPGGMGRGGRINGVELDPLLPANDASKPLYSKLLAVPAWRARYLAYTKDIAQNWLDWNKLGPIAEKYHALIEDAVKADTRKLYSTEAFLKSLTEDSQGEGGPGGGATIALKKFAEQRRAYLLNYTEKKTSAN